MAVVKFSRCFPRRKYFSQETSCSLLYGMSKILHRIELSPAQLLGNIADYETMTMTFVKREHPPYEMCFHPRIP